MTCVDGLMVALYKFISSSRTISCLFQCVVLHWPLGPQHSASKQQQITNQARLFLFRGGSWAAMGLSDILAGLLLDLRWIAYLSTRKQIGAPVGSRATTRRFPACAVKLAALICCSTSLVSDGFFNLFRITVQNKNERYFREIKRISLLLAMCKSTLKIKGSRSFSCVAFCTYLLLAMCKMNRLAGQVVSQSHLFLRLWIVPQ